MLNNLFGGRTGGAGGEGTTTNPLLGQSSLFDDAKDLTDYVDHLSPSREAPQSRKMIKAPCRRGGVR